jgi:hypothetical protein
MDSLEWVMFVTLQKAERWEDIPWSESFVTLNIVQRSGGTTWGAVLSQHSE